MGRKSPICSTKKEAWNYLENDVYRNFRLFLQESPWYNNYVYGTAGKNSKGEERYPVREETEKQRRDLLTKQNQRERAETG